MSFQETEANIVPVTEDVEKANRLCELFEKDLRHQVAWRRNLAARDERYYHNEQRTAEEIKALEDKERAPVQINEIGPVLDSILSDALDVEFDWEVIPIPGVESVLETEELAASVYTCLLNEAKTRSGIEFSQDDVKEDGLIVGRGWVEIDFDGPNISLLHVPWRDMWWDCYAQDKYTLSDARHVERSKWVPYEWALKTYKKQARQLKDLYEETTDEGVVGEGQYPATQDYELSAGEGDKEKPKYVDKKNKRIRLVEMWYYGDDGRVRKALFSKKILISDVDRLEVRPKPLKVNTLPFRSYTVKVDHKGFPYGVVRPLVDLQDIINKRYSKAEFLLDVNQVITQEGLFEDLNDLAQKAAQPDAVIEMPAGAEYGKHFVIERGGELSTQQYSMFVDAIQRIREIGSRNAEALGLPSNARTGPAIARRQQAAANTVYKAFRNMKRFWYELGLVMQRFIRAYYTDERIIRVTNEEGAVEYVNVNGDEARLNLNDPRNHFDLEMTSVPASRDARDRERERMENLGKTLGPDVFPAEMWVENSGLRHKKKIIKWIRQMREAKSQPSPEEQAKTQKLMAEAQAIMIEAGLDEAKAQEVLAKAGLERAQTEGTQIENALLLEKLEALDSGVASIKTWIEGQPKESTDAS
jgi:hypothetical protein